MGIWFAWTGIQDNEVGKKPFEKGNAGQRHISYGLQQSSPEGTASHDQWEKLK